MRVCDCETLLVHDVYAVMQLYNIVARCGLQPQ